MINLSKEDWYKRRGDRLERVEGVSGKYKNFSVGIIVDDDEASKFTAQVMVLTTVNILTRWCKNIRIKIRDTRCCLPGNDDPSFISVLTRIMDQNDPFGDFAFGDFDNTYYTITIGRRLESYKTPSLWIDGSGWLSGIGFGQEHDTLSKTNDFNPIGPAFAACLGTAELFKIAIGVSSLEPENYSTWYSTYSFERNPSYSSLENPDFVSDFDFGRLYLLGCGAIGSSLAFFLTFTHWKGNIHLVDFDKIKPENCSVSLVFTYQMAIDETKKVDACASVLVKSGFQTEKFDGDFSQFRDSADYANHPPDLILCLANEKNIWSTIQHNLPPLVLHATSTKSWGINLGRHIPKSDWCIMCRFGDEVKNEFAPPCSTGIISTVEETPILGSLPFLSPASAIIMLAEMAKLALNSKSQAYNFVEFSMKRAYSLGRFIKILNVPKPNCICAEQKPEYYLEKIKKTKFWK